MKGGGRREEIQEIISSHHFHVHELLVKQSQKPYFPNPRELSAKMRHKNDKMFKIYIGVIDNPNRMNWTDGLLTQDAGTEWSGRENVKVRHESLAIALRD